MRGRIPFTVVAVAALIAARATLPDRLSAQAAAPPDQPVFTAESDLVVLHVTVKDRRGRYVAGLPKEAFTVFEDSRAQDISQFTSEDAPVTVGLLIDNSASMHGNRPLVLAATDAFVENSNPHDEIFALAFDDTVRPVLPHEHPFTSDPLVLREALSHAVGALGRTSLYDAVSAGQDYLEDGRYERKALVVLSDGGDNASRTTFEEVLDRTEASNVVIHTVGIVDPVEQDANPKRLDQLARSSGGVALLPRDVKEVADDLKRIAIDIRSAYTVGYVPSSSVSGNRLHRIRVTVRSPDGRPMQVRTRAGYLTGRRLKINANAH